MIKYIRRKVITFIISLKRLNCNCYMELTFLIKLIIVWYIYFVFMSSPLGKVGKVRLVFVVTIAGKIGWSRKAGRELALAV